MGSPTLASTSQSARDHLDHAARGRLEARGLCVRKLSSGLAATAAPAEACTQVPRPHTHGPAGNGAASGLRSVPQWEMPVGRVPRSLDRRHCRHLQAGCAVGPRVLPAGVTSQRTGGQGHERLCSYPVCAVGERRQGRPHEPPQAHPEDGDCPDTQPSGVKY